jgi:hypothetical protein
VDDGFIPTRPKFKPHITPSTQHRRLVVSRWQLKTMFPIVGSHLVPLLLGASFKGLLWGRWRPPPSDALAISVALLH